MAYASVEDVKARAGRLRGAFGNAGAPDDREIQVFLDQVAGELDARMGALGIATPVVEPVAARALAGPNADGAFLVAVPAAFPTDQAMSQASAAVAEARRRYTAALSAIDAGTFSAVALLLAQAGTGTADATDFFQENPVYDSPAEKLARSLNPWRPDSTAVERKMSF